MTDHTPLLVPTLSMTFAPKDGDFVDLYFNTNIYNTLVARNCRWNKAIGSWVRPSGEHVVDTPYGYTLKEKP